MKRTMIAAAACAIAAAGGRAGAQGDEGKLADRVAKVDKKFLKALEELAVKYDGEKEKDLEAASFFAECAVGFGSKDEKVKAVKLGNELDVYLGKVQGGKPLEKTGPIRQKLDSLTKEYRQVLEDLTKKAGKKQSNLSDGELKILLDVAVKYELARAADEYVKATKRVNELRKAMKLRSVLWDFENSRKLIVGCAPAAEGWSTYANNEKSLKSIYYDADSVKFMVDNAGRGVGDEVAEWVDTLRAYAVVRSDLLNPNARRLWLGHWGTFDGIRLMTAYRIPQLPYREDVPTPTKRHEGATVAQDWVDTEETVDVNGKKIPFSRYPFDGETDLPWYFGMAGDGGAEEGWGDGAGDPSGGLPIMLRFFGTAKLTDAEASLLTKTGKAVSVHVFTDSDKRAPGLKDWPTVVALPEKELVRGATYSITIKCKLDGVAFERTWSFTTKAPKAPR